MIKKLNKYTTMAKLDKKATRQAIFDKCDSSISLSIDKGGFDAKNFSVKDYKEICEEIRIEPIYV